MLCCLCQPTECKPAKSDSSAISQIGWASRTVGRINWHRVHGMQLPCKMPTTKSLFTSSSLRDKYFIYVRKLTKQCIWNVCVCVRVQWAHVLLLISTYYLNINQHRSLYLLVFHAYIHIWHNYICMRFSRTCFIHQHTRTRCWDESSFFTHIPNSYSI